MQYTIYINILYILKDLYIRMLYRIVYPSLPISISYIYIELFHNSKINYIHLQYTIQLYTHKETNKYMLMHIYNTETSLSYEKKSLYTNKRAFARVFVRKKSFTFPEQAHRHTKSQQAATIYYREGHACVTIC